MLTRLKTLLKVFAVTAGCGLAAAPALAGPVLASGAPAAPAADVSTEAAPANVMGPYLYRSTAILVADLLEEEGFYTSVLYRGGYWYVYFW